MARKKQRTNWKLDLSMAELERLAPIVLGNLAPLAQGYRMLPSSGVWQKVNGTLTARFAYRGEDGSGLALTARNIRIPKHQAGGANG